MYACMCDLCSSSYKQVTAVKSGCIGVYRQYNTCNPQVKSGHLSRFTYSVCVTLAAPKFANKSKKKPKQDGF